MKQSNKKRNYIRKCGCCGRVNDQSNMVRVSKRLSDNGWLCEDCYEDIKYEEYENDYEDDW